MDFCSSKNSKKKNHFNVVLFSIGHFTKENYVAARFPPPQGGKNQLVAFVFFFISFGSPLLKEDNFLTNQVEKKILFEPRLPGMIFFSRLKTWWPLSCSMLNCKGTT